MKLHLLENRLALGMSVFGGYWPRGSVKGESFCLVNESGKPVPMQSEIAARWSDGSVKWSRHIASAEELGTGGELAAGEETPCEGLHVEESADEWTVSSARMRLRVPKCGSILACDYTNEEKDGFSSVSPVLQLCRETNEDGALTRRYISLPAEIRERSIEAQGPLEAVFRFDGVHKENGEEKMPFRIRMSVRLTGEIVFDDTFFFKGDYSKDRLAGWGLKFEAALKGRSYQRHIRFLTDGAVYHDNPTQLFHWRKRLEPALLAAQCRGETVEASDALDEAAADLPVWERFCLTQDSAKHFSIRKKAWEDGCFIDAVHGGRAPGCMAASDTEGTIVIAMREFWEKHPAGLEAEALGSERSAFTAWFYSPMAEPFDFRHYDKRSYPMGNYEGFDYSRPDPNGISVTCRASVCALKGYTADEDLKQRSDAVRHPAVYVASPGYYHEHRAFGFWSLPSREDEVQRWGEEQAEKAVAFYEAEVEARSWYGLFNYGDFMHTYEAARHMWRFDVGGYAWDNTELTPTYWLWLQFLRTGSERVFRLADALSRHTADVDMYHFGYMRGLGSRHNVRHWGCPCKEPRVSMAGHHRPLYYLTGDRRIGDCMEDSLGAAESLSAMPWFVREDGKVHLRSGPDWAALVSDWMTAYERTLDPKWRQMIENGLNDIANTPLGLTSGPEFGFDALSGHLVYTGEKVPAGMHLQACMGETEVWLETADMLESKALFEMVARNGRFFYLSPEERMAESGGLLKDRQFGSPIYSAEMQAWAAHMYDDRAMAKRIWKDLLSLLYAKNKPEGYKPVTYALKADGSEITEIPWVTTNFTAQWFIKFIVTKALIPGDAPKSLSELDTQLQAEPSGYRLYGA